MSWPFSVCPENWPIQKIGFLGDQIVEPKMSTDALEYVGLENVRSWTGSYTESEGTKGEKLGLRFERGDVLFGKLRPYLAKVIVAEDRGVCSTEFIVFRCHGELHPRFAAYVFLSAPFIKLIDSSTFGAKMPRASWVFFKSQFIPVPPLADQVAISDFLDSEIARIKKQISFPMSLNLLFSQQTLSRVVESVIGKTLQHPEIRSVKKNSLQGMVFGESTPDNWSLTSLRQIFRVRRNNGNSGMLEKNLLSLSYGKVVRKNIHSNDGLLPESFENYQMVDEGNIVLRLTDLQNDKRSIRQGLAKERGIITSAYDVVQIVGANEPRFWHYTLLALDLAKFYYSLGGGVRQTLKFESLQNYKIARPPFAVQKAIADELDNEFVRIEDLRVKANEIVGSLNQMRAALITAAVTGQVEVA